MPRAIGLLYCATKCTYAAYCVVWMYMPQSDAYRSGYRHRACRQGNAVRSIEWLCGAVKNQNRLARFRPIQNRLVMWRQWHVNICTGHQYCGYSRRMYVWRTVLDDAFSRCTIADTICCMPTRSGSTNETCITYISLCDIMNVIAGISEP